ncbi:unnamed protein product [Thlaspi arvense]|uniref:Uncharacterized protein n=1 Tax=Thlaspi arvense TaxID=13288 RepID=A0AAU9RIB6_THLAR|nr:unnamed protein product [Thlaspi arvense]
MDSINTLQEKRLAQEIADIEKDTGYKLRVVAQNYPQTPGNIINFNVGATLDLDIPRSFWSRLAGKYGNMFYWKEKGEDASIEAAVMAISSCLREPVGRNNCSECAILPRDEIKFYMVEVLASHALTTSAASCPHLAAKIAANFVKSMTWEQKDTDYFDINLMADVVM